MFTADPTTAFYTDIEDPEDTGKVEQSYCVLTEVHANFKSYTVVALFECWRSKQAFEADKQPFNTITIELEPDNGGKEYFAENGADGANMHLAPALRDFCLSKAQNLQGAKKAEG